MEHTNVDLRGVQETLLMPLWERAVESRKKRPLLVDREAERIINSLDYDFTGIERRISSISIASWIARSVYFDEKIAGYLAENPRGTVINIGCGLDTTYERVDNGKAQWYELDFPDVIELRKKLLKEKPNRRFLPFSVFDEQSYSHVADRDNVLVMMAGVIYYFEEKEVSGLLETFIGKFRKCVLIFDYSSRIGMKIANKRVIENGGMDASAYLKWGVNDIRELESLNDRIRVAESMKLFKTYRKKFPLRKGIGMWVSDALSIMSLAELALG